MQEDQESFINKKNDWWNHQNSVRNKNNDNINNKSGNRSINNSSIKYVKNPMILISVALLLRTMIGNNDYNFNDYFNQPTIIEKKSKKKIEKNCIFNQKKNFNQFSSTGIIYFLTENKSSRDFVAGELRWN